MKTLRRSNSEASQGDLASGGNSEGEPRTRRGEVNKQGVRQPQDEAACTIISTLLLL